MPDTSSNTAPMEVPDLSVAEAADFIGVSRARVYQRVTGTAGAWDAGRPLPSVLRETNRPGTKAGHQRRISIADALAWEPPVSKAVQLVPLLAQAIRSVRPPTDAVAPPGGWRVLVRCIRAMAVETAIAPASQGIPPRY